MIANTKMTFTVPNTDKTKSLIVNIVVANIIKNAIRKNPLKTKDPTPILENTPLKVVKNFVDL
ncbi:MAG: hypothetical protein QXL85_06370 [Candidatus Bathyarchaeia archaeon]